MIESKNLAIIPHGIAECSDLAERLSKSTLLPDALKNKPQDVMFQIMTGAELGLGPIASIRGIYVIQGKPVLSADTMVALVMGSGQCEYFIQTEASATSVTFETKRKNAPVVQRTTWTWEDAKRAGLNTKDTWRLYPKQMLASRAKAELARLAYSDILAGCYDPDEIDAPVPVRTTVTQRDPKPANDIVDAEIVEPVGDDLLDRVTAAESLATLDALKPRCNALPNGPIRTQVREAYGVRMKHFESVAKASAAIEKTVVVESVA